MFEFGKRDTAAKEGEHSAESKAETSSGHTMATRPASSHSVVRSDAAVIGPSIHIQGDLQGEEDLVIEGEVKGTVFLKNNNLTIGGQGKVIANVYAKTVVVDGHMEGDLYAAERVSIRKAARVLGNVVSPRVSLEDGARLKGSIEMDPEAIERVFKNQPGLKAAASLPAAAAAKGATVPGKSPAENGGAAKTALNS